MDTYTDWLNARENARTAIDEMERSGKLAIELEWEYEKAKTLKMEELKADGYSATWAKEVVDGLEPVCDIKRAMKMAQLDEKCDSKRAALFTNEEAHTYDQHKRAFAGDSERY